MRRNQTDIENLIAGLHRSDRKAINETILRYGRLVTSIAGSMLSDPRDTEELTQDTFIRVFGSIKSFNPQISQLSTWIARIAYNTAIDYLRKCGSKPTEGPTDLIQDLPNEANDDDTYLPELIDTALEHISAEERTTIQLVYFNEMSLDEAAYILGTNANALSTRLYRIRNKLAVIINDLKQKQ